MKLLISGLLALIESHTDTFNADVNAKNVRKHFSSMISDYE